MRRLNRSDQIVATHLQLTADDVCRVERNDGILVALHFEDAPLKTCRLNRIRLILGSIGINMTKS
jgi:hypothetical protein